MTRIPEVDQVYETLHLSDKGPLELFKKLQKKLMKQAYISGREKREYRELQDGAMPYSSVRSIHEYLENFLSVYLPELQQKVSDESVYKPFVQYLAILYSAEIRLHVSQARKGSAMLVMQHQEMNRRNKSTAEWCRKNGSET